MTSRTDLASSTPVRCVVPERFDAMAVEEARSGFAIALDAGATSIEVDLAPVTFMDSAGLAALVRLMKELRSRGGDLMLGRPVAPEVVRLLELTRFDAVFTLVDFDANDSAG